MREPLKRRWYIITTTSGEVRKYSTSPQQAIKDLYKYWYGISGRGAEERAKWTVREDISPFMLKLRKVGHFIGDRKPLWWLKYFGK